MVNPPKDIYSKTYKSKALNADDAGFADIKSDQAKAFGVTAKN
jgi:hypothetical protein